MKRWLAWEPRTRPDIVVWNKLTHKARRLHVIPGQLALPFPAIDAANIPAAGQDMTESEAIRQPRVAVTAIRAGNSPKGVLVQRPGWDGWQVNSPWLTISTNPTRSRGPTMPNYEEALAGLAS